MLLLQQQADKRLQEVLQQFGTMIADACQAMSEEEDDSSEGRTQVQVPSSVQQDVVPPKVNTVHTTQL